MWTLTSTAAGVPAGGSPRQLRGHHSTAAACSAAAVSRCQKAMPTWSSGGAQTARSSRRPLCRQTMTCPACRRACRGPPSRWAHAHKGAGALWLPTRVPTGSHSCPPAGQHGRQSSRLSVPCPRAAVLQESIEMLNSLPENTRTCLIEAWLLPCRCHSPAWAAPSPPASSVVALPAGFGGPTQGTAANSGSLPSIAAGCQAGGAGPAEEGGEQRPAAATTGGRPTPRPAGGVASRWAAHL